MGWFPPTKGFTLKNPFFSHLILPRSDFWVCRQFWWRRRRQRKAVDVGAVITFVDADERRLAAFWAASALSCVRSETKFHKHFTAVSYDRRRKTKIELNWSEVWCIPAHYKDFFNRVHLNFIKSHWYEKPDKISRHKEVIKGQYYKTIFVRNLWIFVISLSVCHWQVFPA
jgi:hypothetical protein